MSVDYRSEIERIVINSGGASVDVFTSHVFSIDGVETASSITGENYPTKMATVVDALGEIELTGVFNQGSSISFEVGGSAHTVNVEMESSHTDVAQLIAAAVESDVSTVTAFMVDIDDGVRVGFINKSDASPAQASGVNSSGIVKPVLPDSIKGIISGVL